MPPEPAPPCRLRLAILFTALALPGTALSHDWYPYACCSAMDCYPVSDASDITAMADGWHIRASGEVIGYSDARLRHTPPQAQGDFHRCSTQGVAKAKTICLFVPDFGS